MGAADSVLLTLIARCILRLKVQVKGPLNRIIYNKCKCCLLFEAFLLKWKTYGNFIGTSIAINCRSNEKRYSILPTTENATETVAPFCKQLTKPFGLPFKPALFRPRPPTSPTGLAHQPRPPASPTSLDYPSSNRSPPNSRSNQILIKVSNPAIIPNNKSICRTASALYARGQKQRKTLRYMQFKKSLTANTNK